MHVALTPFQAPNEHYDRFPGFGSNESCPQKSLRKVCCVVQSGSSADNSAMIRKRTAILLAVLTGVALELGIHAMSGRREAWDSTEFWTIGLPAAALISVAIGYMSLRSDWLWTALVAPSQMATMMVRGGEIGNLWPLTLILSTLLSTPFLIAALIGSTFRRRK